MKMLIPDDPDERKTYALRIIAQRCLYGVDKNPLAVEMAKLSLWLLTLAKDKPFEFLDHCIRCGDSLVGMHNLDQLRHFSLEARCRRCRLFRDRSMVQWTRPSALRLKLEDMPANTVEDVERQEKLLQGSQREDRPAAMCGGLARGRRVLGRECQGQVGAGSPCGGSSRPLFRERTDRRVRARSPPRNAEASRCSTGRWSSPK